MPVFPEQMNKLNVDDVPGSLKKIDNYIRYMTERVEFANTNTSRTVTAAGVSTVGLYEAVLEQNNAIAALNANVNIVAGSINALNTKVNEIQSALDGLGTTVTELSKRVANLEGKTEA